MSTGRAIWITGVPASGKTTLARRLIHRLRERGVVTLHLDSDDLRPALSPAATYDADDRDRFYAALAHIARLGVEGGATVVISATASRRTYRDALRAEVGRLVEIWLDCSIETARTRDPKGLYRRAEAGEITNLPGASAPYEAPRSAELRLDSGWTKPEDLAQTVLDYLDANEGR